MPCRSLVWFKRDLRLRDHAPLAAAARADAAAGIYLIEPDWLASPEGSSAHVAFALEGLDQLRRALAARGLPLLVEVGEACHVFERLRARFPFDELLSHEETGSGWSFRRDRAVAAWCRRRGVAWTEFPQTGVVRRLPSRDGWARRWQARMDAPPVPTPEAFRGAAGLPLHDLPDLARLGLAPHGKQLQGAGEAPAQATLASFLAHRGHDYLKSISSPLRAERGGSRLSPYLTFGMLSMRQVHQATVAAIGAREEITVRRALRGFAGRLRWHCHFMQKLESQPSLEFRNLARATDGLREGEFDRERFEAWCAGATGYPMVDACMRSLRATGWLNFRMRAMLVSFAAYHLWLHWREPGLFLAGQFLDYEAGIHWSQMQMQSGTTGINTLRMYSPAKQARDHDPGGHFIRRWVPELARVPLPLLAEPWRMDAAQQRAAGCVIGRDYPAPLVEEKAALARARDRLYAVRREPGARAEADAIQGRHGSRRSGLPSTTRRRRRSATPSPQSDLFK
ncbi:MAG: deoxyribodipyrimidine photo-lyase [Xanthomonadaceae bacterium]|nr:deoxyribodipyrimidine photo-lyase [Xanthomonadaceae bacterium]